MTIPTWDDVSASGVAGGDKGRQNDLASTRFECESAISPASHGHAWPSGKSDGVHVVCDELLGEQLRKQYGAETRPKSGQICWGCSVRAPLDPAWGSLPPSPEPVTTCGRSLPPALARAAVRPPWAFLRVLLLMQWPRPYRLFCRAFRQIGVAQDDPQTPRFAKSLRPYSRARGPWAAPKELLAPVRRSRLNRRPVHVRPAAISLIGLEHRRAPTAFLRRVPNGHLGVLFLSLSGGTAPRGGDRRG